MCKDWGSIWFRIWIGNKMESRIRIRVGINTMPIKNTGQMMSPNIILTGSYPYIGNLLTLQINIFLLSYDIKVSSPPGIVRKPKNCPSMYY